jgi:hypothetical protein
VADEHAGDHRGVHLAKPRRRIPPHPRLGDQQPCAAAVYAPSDIRSLATHEPAGISDQFEHNVGVAYDGPTGPRLHRRGPALADVDTAAAAAYAQGMYARMLGEAAAATQDDVLLDAAIGDYQIWAPIALTLQAQFPEFHAYGEQVLTTLSLALQESMARNRILCFSDGFTAVANMLRTYQWMELPEFATRLGDLSQYQQAIRDCAKFEVKLDSVISESTCNLGFTVSSHFTASYSVTAEFTPDGDFTCASGPVDEPLTVDSIQMCSPENIVFPNPPVGSPIHGSGLVAGLMFTVPPRRTLDATGEILPSLRLRLFPFLVTPNENMRYIGVFGNPPPVLTIFVWAGVFAVAHQDEVMELAQGQAFELSGFTPGADASTTATLQYAEGIAIGAADFHEMTRIDVVHTPN